MFYTFDPKRQAVLLLGGSKAGKEKRFYKQMIPQAEKAWESGSLGGVPGEDR